MKVVELTQATMTVVNHHITAESNSCVVVYTTCTVCDISHDDCQSTGEPTQKAIQYAVCAGRQVAAHRSMMSAIVHANICKPSGIWSATIVALFLRM